jgi:predicted dehydrogenase
LITVSILGGGFMATTHAASYQKLGGRVRVVSVCSLGEERALRLAASLGARHLDSIDQAVSDPDVDVVDICLPTHLHRPAAEKAFAAGRHVLVEKPIALSVEDADAIVAAAASSGRFLMVALVLRFWPEYVELHRLITSKELGPPRSVSTYRLSPPADWNDWMADISRSGGVAVDLLLHDLDQMNWLLGRPARVLARSPKKDHVLAVVEYESGACGFAEAGSAMPTSFPFSSGIRVLCERGAAEHAFSAAPAVDGGNVGSPTSARGLHVFRSEGESIVPVDNGDAWAAEITHFLDSVERGQAPEQGTAEQARTALLVSLAVNRSIASGRMEPV